MRQCDGLAIEIIQRAFTKQLVGRSLNPSYRGQCTTLHHASIWLRREKPSLQFLNRLSNGNSCISAPHFRNQAPYSLCNTLLVITTDTARRDITAHVFLIEYSSLRRLLPQRLRLLSSSNIAPKTGVRRSLTTPTLKSIYDTYISQSRGYEVGLIFCK